MALEKKPRPKHPDAAIEEEFRRLEGTGWQIAYQKSRLEFDLRCAHHGHPHHIQVPLHWDKWTLRNLEEAIVLHSFQNR